jgi:hypothetical protein
VLEKYFWVAKYAPEPSRIDPKTCDFLRELKITLVDPVATLGWVRKVRVAIVRAWPRIALVRFYIFFFNKKISLYNFLGLLAKYKIKFF